MREHTRLLGLASQWLSAGRPASRLLSGDDIAKAKAWLTESRQTKTEPTALHIDFIRASEDEASTRLTEVRHQLEERERLVQEAEAALKDKETARRREAEALRRGRRNALIGALVAVMLALTAGGFGYYALKQQQQAVVEAGRADAAARDAIKRRDEALLTQSRFLADVANQRVAADGRPDWQNDHDS